MLILHHAPLGFAGGEYRGFHQLKQTNGLSQKTQELSTPFENGDYNEKLSLEHICYSIVVVRRWACFS